MTVKDMLITAETMEKQIESANALARLAIQPEFHRLLQRIRADGGKVPFRLRRLEAMLCEEATEAQFDNMPV